MSKRASVSRRTVLKSAAAAAAAPYVITSTALGAPGVPPASERLTACGCGLAATLCGPGPVETMLAVPACGVSIKQNARIALLREA